MPGEAEGFAALIAGPCALIAASLAWAVSGEKSIGVWVFGLTCLVMVGPLLRRILEGKQP